MASSPYAVRRKLTKVQRERYIGRMRRLLHFGAPEDVERAARENLEAMSDGK